MELGILTFGDLHPDSSGRPTSPAQGLSDLLERARLADEVGLDSFAIGEHHRPDFSISAPIVAMAAAASVTKRIRLGSGVTVLSTEDPVRVYQQFSTADLISGGRIELAAGRGSFIESYPLFGADLNDYHELFEEKIDLLLRIDEGGPITWKGRFRPALEKAEVLPRPFGKSLDIWIATGGTPESSERAGRLGRPVVYAVIGGEPRRFEPLVDLYREAHSESGSAIPAKVAFSGFGLLGEDAKATKEAFYPHYEKAMRQIARERGFSPPNRTAYDLQANGHGAFLVGSPSEIADRILALHRVIPYERQVFQMDLANVPHALVMKSIELLGTKVRPILEAAGI